MTYTHKILLEKYRKMIESEVIIERIMEKLIEGDHEGIDKCLVRLTENNALTDDEAEEITRRLGL